MATIQYGALQLVPAPLLGLNVQSKFLGADIRFANRKVYSLKGTIINPTTDGISGIYTDQNSLITGFKDSYFPFSIDGNIVGYPKINSISFDNGPLVRTNGYNIELEVLDSGNPFQFTGVEYGFTGVSGLFYNIESISENLEFSSDFRTSNRTHSVDITYRTGFNINPLLNAKLIASGLIKNIAAYPFITTIGPSGITTYEERINEFAGNYSVTEKFASTTGNLNYEHFLSWQFQLAENGIITVTENGLVKGYDPNRYNNAKSGYALAMPGTYNNCQSFYSRYASGTLNNTYLADSRVDDINLGQITYARAFTDETGVSTFKWQYSQSLTLEGNFMRTAEQGNIFGLNHISQRFSTASGAWETIRPGIQQRLSEQYSGYGFTGFIYNVGRSQTFDRFNGKIDYSYEYSNRNTYSLGSGIRSLEMTITDQPPLHANVFFNVINAGVIAQSLEATKQGQRTVALDIVAFRETAQTGLLQFTTNKLNERRPLGTSFIDPFLNRLSVTYNPLVNSLTAESTYLFGGFRTVSGLDL